MDSSKVTDIRQKSEKQLQYCAAPLTFGTRPVLALGCPEGRVLAYLRCPDISGDQGIHTSWETLREQLSTHQVVTVRLRSTDGHVFTIRREKCSPKSIWYETRWVEAVQIREEKSV